MSFLALFFGYGFVSVGLFLGLVALAGVRLRPWLVLPAVPLFIANGLIGYFGMPTVNYGFYGIWFPVLFVGGVAFWVIFPELDAWGNTRWNMVRLLPAVATCGIAIIAITLLPLLTTWSALGNADNYRNLIGNVEESTFQEDMAPIDPTQIRTVDQTLASEQASKRLGEDAGLGSRTKVGTHNIQTLSGTCAFTDKRGNTERVTFDGDLFWVGPLTHTSVFKYWSHGSTPGFTMVSADNHSNMRMVTEINGEPLEINYLVEGGHFGNYLPRHLYLNGYMTVGYTDYSFELRDGDCRPHWVVTRYEKRVGYSGRDAEGVIVVDAQTGEITEYSIENAPEWIDRIQPDTMVREQLRNWGDYVHGWWNSWFGERDVINPTDSVATEGEGHLYLVYGNDGRAYWYTGMTSTKSDASTTGFILSDSRTKETKYYKISGSTEQAACRAAENHSDVRDKQYRCSMPILYNIGGEPTYFMALKGDDGLPKAFAFVNVADRSIMGVHTDSRDPSGALQEYQMAMLSDPSIDAEGVVSERWQEATVLRVTAEGGGDNTQYYLLLEGMNSREFYGTSAVSPELKWTEPGDRVKIIYPDQQSGPTTPINAFDNLELSLDSAQ